MTKSRRTDIFRRISLYLIFAAVFALFALPVGAYNDDAPGHFSYAELRSLYELDTLSAPLEFKLNRLLTSPFVDNSHGAAARPALARAPQLGEFLRVAQWNIERGLEYAAIEAALAGEAEFAALLDAEEFPLGSEKRANILEEARALRGADVIVLNEVDWGVKRTEYRNVAAALAARLKMNYAFGVQFVELSPIALSEKKAGADADENEILELIKIDPDVYRGLHGIAILSRFPLENVRLVPFKTQPYDWFASEKKGASIVEKGKREIAKKIFLEETLREVRRGGRATLFADLVDERFPSGRVTVAATHLENRTKPANRVLQLEELLESVKDINNPVILAGDLNTSTEDLTPTSIRRELTKRFGNPKFWIKKGVSYALGIGLFEDIVMSGVTFGRKLSDPTARHIPYVSPNPEHKFFKTLENFRFADGGAFDFRGDRARSSNGKSGELANSNQRAVKGFVTTFQVKRPIKFIGKYKLDWIFVKPARLTAPTDRAQSYVFAPHFGRTLADLNGVLEDRISDHRPLLVDLPLGEPQIGQNKRKRN